MLSRLSTSVVTGLAFAAVGGSAVADITPSDPFLRINVNSGAYVGWFNVDLSSADVQALPGAAYLYTLPVAGDFVYDNNDAGMALAQINELSVLVYSPEAAGFGLITDPEYRVNLNFNVTNLLGTTATINMFSTSIAFPGVTDWAGAASASFSATDTNLDGNLDVVGQFANGNMWQASYNGGTDFATILQGGSSNVFADTIGGFENFPFDADPLDGILPNPQYVPIPGMISSMMTKYSFSVTSGDSVAGTSTFVIVPTPGAAVLLALGGVAFSARRRGR